MLDTSILKQVSDVFAGLENDYVLDVRTDVSRAESAELKAFVNDFVSTSAHLSANFTDTNDAQLSFSLLKGGQPVGITFRGIPNGHEFTSLLLAVLNADGKGKNLPDEAISRRIANLKGEIKLQTYVSLTCTNCPDVVQALNIVALANSRVSSEMIDGALFQDEVARLNIQAVPAVYANGELLHIGRGDLGELLGKLEDMFGSEEDSNAEPVERQFDLVVIGGGPAGSAAAIYSARKGLKVAVVAGRIGGQVKDTVGIENLVSVPQTTGAQLADDLRSHIGHYPIEIFENRKLERVDFSQSPKRVYAKGGEVFVAPAVVVATGASWRRLNVDDEAKYMGKGVHFCPHCDGPFYKGKNVAVVGGGNSGIEAAIDLAGICRHVILLEFADTMRADEVLQQKVASLANVELHTSTQTTALLGEDGRLTGITVKDCTTDEERTLRLDGVFVQIGLSPNSDTFKDELELTPRREIPVDATNRTSVPGVYAAGDVTTVPYKQITIAMGEGAKAALSAFEDRIRGVI